MPKKYSQINILENIKRKKKNVEIIIIGRSNATWFKGDICKHYNNELFNYCRIKFVIQYNFIENDNIDIKTKDIIAEEYDVVVNKYMEIYGSIGGAYKDKFELYLTDKKIENSIMYIKYESQNKDLWYDITQIQSSARPIILMKNDFIPSDILEKTENILQNCKKLSCQRPVEMSPISVQ